MRRVRTHPAGAKKVRLMGSQKIFKKWYKNNVVMVGLTISMHFQLFEDLKFRFFFPEEHVPPGPPKNPCSVSNRPEWGGIVPILLKNPKSRLDFSRDTSIPILKNSSDKPTSREIDFLLNYHKICDKINKPLNLDIQANAELQSWWITQEIQNKITQQVWPVRSEVFLASQHF